MRKILILILLLASFLTGLGQSELYGGQDIPLHLEVFHEIITKHGYTSISASSLDKPNMLGYEQPGSLVFVALDNAMNITGGGVVFLPRHNEAPYYALAAIHTILQYRLGKLPLDEKAAGRKGVYLNDIIKHNLKLMDETEFLFDDIVVNARKYREVPSITVSLRLR